VALAWLASAVSYLLCIWPYQYHASDDGWHVSWVEISVPVLISLIILYCGSLYQEWSRLPRALYLTAVSVLIYLGMLVSLVFLNLFFVILLLAYDAGKMNRGCY